MKMTCTFVSTKKDHKKGLKIPTDNTMAKGKSTNNDLQNIHIKLSIE